MCLPFSTPSIDTKGTLKPKAKHKRKLPCPCLLVNTYYIFCDYRRAGSHPATRFSPRVLRASGRRSKSFVPASALSIDPETHPKIEVRCCSPHFNISPDPASIHPASILPQRDAILCPCPRRRNCCPTGSIGAVSAPPLPGRRSLSTTPPYSFSLVRRRDRRPTCAIAASPARSLPRPRDRRPDHANNAPPA